MHYRIHRHEELCTLPVGPNAFKTEEAAGEALDAIHAINAQHAERARLAADHPAFTAGWSVEEVEGEPEEGYAEDYVPPAPEPEMQTPPIEETGVGDGEDGEEGEESFADETAGDTEPVAEAPSESRAEESPDGTPEF